MNHSTVELLREAAIQALQNKQDEAAVELLGFINPPTVSTPPAPIIKSLPSAPEIVDGPAHDYHYWAQLIREQFIPFLYSNGRIRFTSHELLEWLKHCADYHLTTGDTETHTDGKIIWRNTVSYALGHLKRQGVVLAPDNGKQYSLPPRKPALASLKRPVRFGES